MPGGNAERVYVIGAAYRIANSIAYALGGAFNTKTVTACLKTWPEAPLFASKLWHSPNVNTTRNKDT